MSKHTRALLLATLILPGSLFAQAAAEDKPPADEPILVLEKFVTGRGAGDTLGVLPAGPSQSVFGFGKGLLETPRSVSVVSAEMIAQYGVDNIEGLAALVPSSYTTSSFGIAGSLDLRGTGGENYFRGMKRIENGGVYPTPIGATDRVEVVRGPPSPVYGPGKIGGYLNFVPKSSRAGTGKYLDRGTGKMTLTAGSWDKRVATVEQGGPLKLSDKHPAGYYIYTMLENSSSYYRNAGNEQFILQSSFEVELNANWRAEFGQQYHEWASIEISGINRLTQDYIDHGTYVSGRPLNNIDSNGDGFLSPAEFTAAGGMTRSFAYGTPAATVIAGLGSAYGLDPATVKTVQLDGNLILSDAGDFANARSAIYFLDVVNDRNENLIIKNQTIVDTLTRKKDTSQGFATMASAFLAENKTTVAQKLAPAKWLEMTNTAAASVRYFDGENRSYTATQPFNRRDLSVGALNSYDRIWSSLDNATLAPWNANRDSEHYDYGLGVLTDMKIVEKLNVIAGGRVDYLDIWAKADPNSTTDGAATGVFKTTGVSNTETAYSWMASVSYAVKPGLIPYATYSKQQSMQIGNIGDVAPANVATPITQSELKEAGFKANLLKNRLFLAASAYEQTREAINPDTFESFTTRGRGIEVEARYAPTSRLSFTASANWQKTIYLRPPTSFTVPAEFFGVPGWMAYGGLLTVTNIPATAGYLERGGLPDKVMSFYGTYNFRNGFGFTLGGIYTASMSSGSAKTFVLPSVFRVDGAIYYTTKTWEARLRVNNATDERYFQSNSPDNNGNTVAIQKLPRHFEATLAYRF